MANITDIDKLIIATEIHERIISASTIIDKNTKDVYIDLSKFIRGCLTNKSQSIKFTSYEMKTLTNELLKYWNGTINPDTETFWSDLKNYKVELERKSPLKFALEKNRFRTVEHGIEARKFWNDIKNLKSVTEIYTNKEIQAIEAIIRDDEKKRLDILKKCLFKKSIPSSQYLKFGECMAYFSNCRIWLNHFSIAEAEELHELWKNFGSENNESAEKNAT